MSRYVDLGERVTAQFYDQEHEEWTMQTVTIKDVLDSVCDEYTVLPSAQPEIIRCKDCKHRCETEDGEYNPEDIVCAYWMSDGLSETDYCSHAERREE